MQTLPQGGHVGTDAKVTDDCVRFNVGVTQGTRSSVSRWTGGQSCVQGHGGVTQTTVWLSPGTH